MKKRVSAEKRENRQFVDRMPVSSSEDETDHRLGPIGTTLIVGLSQDNLLFTAFAVVQVVGVLMIGLCAIWGQHFLNGYSWSDSKQVFNYHPLLMTIGMIYLNANGMCLKIIVLNFDSKERHKNIN